jgi:hypothetical protein
VPEWRSKYLQHAVRDVPRNGCAASTTPTLKEALLLHTDGT